MYNSQHVQKKRDRDWYPPLEDINGYPTEMDCSDDHHHHHHNTPSPPPPPQLQDDRHQKKTMHQKPVPTPYTHLQTLDLTVINYKIEEVHALLAELYQIKEYFEKKLEPSPKERCSYLC